MTKLELDLETTVPPDRVRAALLDFTDRRPALWPGIAPDLYEVYEVRQTTALVKEGSRFPGLSAWAVERYDWSDPDVVTWTTEDSDFCAPGSVVTARFAPRPGGGSRIHLSWNRTPTTVAGRMMFAMIVLTRGRPIASSFRAAMDRLAAQSV